MWWMMSNEGGHYCSKKSDDICCDVCGQFLALLVAIKVSLMCLSLQLWMIFWIQVLGLDYEYKAVNLVKEEQNSPEFRNLNPLGYVPVLVDGDVVLSDSFAILLYLAEKYPQHPFLPSDLKTKAINFQVNFYFISLYLFLLLFSMTYFYNLVTIVKKLVFC
ncbi:hypothetical protein Patl1_28031 [Pistacia atlantica]|uniref:Uncharacterized protein n=1 Tax=Pistacia atlantica TaxID=434234 RepID=A0ACC1BC10_9ROSI|nr:hypothetical protein Patl1_28031 [Pistacia atlantica]